MTGQPAAAQATSTGLPNDHETMRAIEACLNRSSIDLELVDVEHQHNSSHTGGRYRAFAANQGVARGDFGSTRQLSII